MAREAQITALIVRAAPGGGYNYLLRFCDSSQTVPRGHYDYPSQAFNDAVTGMFDDPALCAGSVYEPLPHEVNGLPVIDETDDDDE